MPTICDRKPTEPTSESDLGQDVFIKVLISRKVNQLLKRPDFHYHERKDLSQDILLRIVKGMHLYDPKVGHRNPYIQSMVERHVANLIREREAEKRTASCMTSLNVPVESMDSPQSQLLDTISTLEHDRRLGREAPKSHEEQADLRSDLSDAIATLPSDLRDITERLKTHNIAEVARDLGIARSSLQFFLGQIRERFEEAGLLEYFEN